MLGRAAAEKKGDFDFGTFHRLQKDAILEDFRPLVHRERGRSERILEAFARVELDPVLGRNGDFSSRLGVPALAGLPFFDLEASEPGKSDFSPVFQGVFDPLEQRGERLGRLEGGDSRILGHPDNRFFFVHFKPPSPSCD